MSLWRLLKSMLFRFDAETAHLIVVRTLHLFCQLLNTPLRPFARSGLRFISRGPLVRPRNSSRCEVFGMEFSNPVGLAAGFDKNAEILTALPHLGFGFVELGTVTPVPQPGNQRPRLFRIPEEESLFNRMGFNSLGGTVVCDRLRKIRAQGILPPQFRVGINIGMNKTTPLDQAPSDYGVLAAQFKDLADYVVINVSSPNTPGLRSLQTKDSLAQILKSVQNGVSEWKNTPPILIKWAPEMFSEASFVPEGELEGWIRDLEALGVSGWVVCNTLGGKFQGQDGGFSGRKVAEASAHALKKIKKWSSKPLISVGGIMTPEDARLRLEWGASLVQVYSGWIFGGPSLPWRIQKGLNK